MCGPTFFSRKSPTVVKLSINSSIFNTTKKKNVLHKKIKVNCVQLKLNVAIIYKLHFVIRIIIMIFVVFFLCVLEKHEFYLIRCQVLWCLNNSRDKYTDYVFCILYIVFQYYNNINVH